MAQQSRKVTGTVLDYAKEPIIGANVILKGTSRGVITDVKGEFTFCLLYTSPSPRDCS